MDSKEFLKNVYSDFFGIDKIKKENEKLAKEIEEIKEYPKIELNEKTENNSNQNIGEILNNNLNKDKIMTSSFEKIDKLYITEESKSTLKKMIEYMRKYSENIEKQYIPFNMCIYTKTKELAPSIAEIIADATSFFSYVKKADVVEVSMQNFEKNEQIEEIYSSRNGVILLKELEALVLKDKSFKDRFWSNIEEKIVSNPKEFLTILTAKNKDVLESAFGDNIDVKLNFFDFEIISEKPDIQDIFEEVKNKLQESSNLTDEFNVKLLDYISFTYPKYEDSYITYINKLCSTILFNKENKLTESNIPSYEKDKSLDEVFAKLNELVGLKKVKQVLQDLVSLIDLKNKAKDNLKIKETNLHMVFLGNPGTGKTTVARLIAQILYNLKYIKQNKLIEVSSKDLVAEYVGQTGPKTMAVVEKALGGVLFIDESYSLASGNGQGNSYNEEAIATLIQAMENNRDNLVVIFAGYTKEMQAFLNANSGIVSRIGYTLEFEDYNENELLQIFESMTKKAGFIITEDAKIEVLKIIKEYKNTKNFGNARFVRNLYEKTIIKHATNIKNKKSKKALVTIGKEDVNSDNLLKM